MAHPDQLKAPSVAEAPARPRIAALVALKRSELAKSRLTTLPAPLRSRLAWTMALDTLTSLARVLPVIVISNQPDLAERLHRKGISAEVIAEPRTSGINAALRRGEEAATNAGFSGSLACVGDLPALRPESVRRVLAASAVPPRAFLADASGVGTTMLIARGGQLDPQFQGRSAIAHRASGAVALGAEELGGNLPDARRDVDDEADLSEAFQLGLGPATRQLFDSDGRLGRYAMIIIENRLADGCHQALIIASGSRLTMPTESAEAELGRLRPGLQLHAVISSGRVLSAWLP
jgi:2-phospho-L-lactate/phosphoenolpyruvate guanylyltransferase